MKTKDNPKLIEKYKDNSLVIGLTEKGVIYCSCEKGRECNSVLNPEMMSNCGIQQKIKYFRDILKTK